MSTFLKKEWISLLGLIATIAVGFYYHALLPDKVPTHFNLAGEADDWGSKYILLIILPVLNVCTYLLLFFLPKLDPKKKIDSSFSKPLPQVRTLIVFLVFGLNWVILDSALAGSLNPKWLVGVISGVVFVGMGNFMSSIKPNYFLGFRTPWTLESPEVWKATHRLVSKIWVIGGLIFLGLLPFITIEIMLFVLFAFLGISVAWPLVYSYSLYKRITQKI